ncbi:MAG: PQQ-binding-like beta-propeller repeat protein, partial [Candidatus Bathyarchaeota archaeon]|nr:PQQ-binding-like beta-propeller repeat protein [Candidatus Termiticorpusculum sp.]
MEKDYNMIKFKNNRFFSTIAILMMLAFVMSMFTIQNTNAQTWTKVVAWPFVDALPNPAGVGQPVLINWGLINYLNNVNDGWNVTLQITDPNGKATNYTAKTWSTGTVGRKMSFSEPGNYTLQTLYNGERYSYQSGNTWIYKDVQPAESETITLEIIEGYWKIDHPGHSLPTEYWTRPVDSQLREWYTMLGSWTIARDSRSAPLYVLNNDGPESAHILWNMPIGDNFGGLSGSNGYVAYETGEAYDGKFANSLILGGVLYYNKYVSNSPLQTVVAVDLHTGKIVWEKDFTFGSASANRPSGGQILTFISENNRGAWAYLWFTSGATMYAVNPVTGDLIYTMTNVPSGTIYFGPSGEMLKYRMVNYGTTTNPNWYLQQWNSTYVVNNGTRDGTADVWGTNVRGQTYNADRFGWDFNASISGLTFIPGQSNVPTNSAVGSLSGAVQQAAPITVGPEIRAVFGNTSVNGVTLMGISLDSENKGYLLYSRRDWQAPAEWADLQSFGWAAHSHEDAVGVIWTKDNTKNYGFSLETGKFLWETESQKATDAWASRTGCIAYGKFYTASTSGILYCYDIQTGDLVWTYAAKDKYNESYHGENWWLIIQFITDGKIYVGHEVHSPTVPITRGAPYLVIDCETGNPVWEIDGAFRQNHWGGRSIIGDSIIATMDTYDQQIYAIGKGPSEMTISAPNVAIPTNTK